MKRSSYINYIIEKGINLQPNQTVEIVSSSYLKDFVFDLRKACLKKGASFVYIKYIDGKDLESKINDDYDILKDIEHYKGLIKEGFARIVIQSPFMIPMVIETNRKKKYQNKLKQLIFVNDYFNNLESQRTICLAANPYWASKLNITIEQLWDIIFDYSLFNDEMSIYKDYLNDLKINKIIFKNSLGTNLEVALTSNFTFQDKHQITPRGVKFQPNIPCLELYTAPNKYNVNGVVVSSKPIYYYGEIINDYKIVFKDGKIIDSINLNKVLDKDESLLYAGEIALVRYSESINLYSTLLNENLCSHIGLGYAYPYGIKELDKINKSQYHVDLFFGTKDLECLAVCEDENIYIMKNGEFIYEK